MNYLEQVLLFPQMYCKQCYVEALISDLKVSADERTRTRTLRGV
jgi:hypothetical protein